MNRYSVIDDKNPREIVLLRSHPCRWGRCFFCDYIADNSIDEEGTRGCKGLVWKARGN